MSDESNDSNMSRVPAVVRAAWDRWHRDVHRVELGDDQDMPRIWRFVLRAIAAFGFTAGHFQRRRMPRQTAGLAFATALSLVPVLVLFVSIVNGLGLLDDAGSALVDGLVSNLFPVDRETASTQMQAFVENAASAYAGGSGSSSRWRPVSCSSKASSAYSTTSGASQRGVRSVSAC